MVVDDKSDGCASVLIAGEFLEWMQGSHQVGVSVSSLAVRLERSNPSDPSPLVFAPEYTPTSRFNCIHSLHYFALFAHLLIRAGDRIRRRQVLGSEQQDKGASPPLWCVIPFLLLLSSVLIQLISVTRTLCAHSPFHA